MPGLRGPIFGTLFAISWLWLVRHALRDRANRPLLLALVLAFSNILWITTMGRLWIAIGYLLPALGILAAVFGIFLAHVYRSCRAMVNPRTANIGTAVLFGCLLLHGQYAAAKVISMYLARKHGIAVVEDNAHGLLGKYRGRFLGTLGCLATLSFHETKNISCGEGGALLLNDLRFEERAEILREKGTNRSRFFRGQVDKYTWVDVGSSYLPSDLLAAFLFAQLEKNGVIQSRRRYLWHVYADQLRHWAEDNNVRLPLIPPHCDQAYHMFYVVMPSLENQHALIAWLRKHAIHGVFHYQPLHLSSMGSAFGGRKGDCPITEAIADRMVRLPFYFGLTNDEQQRVINAVCRFQGVPVDEQARKTLLYFDDQQRAA